MKKHYLILTLSCLSFLGYSQEFTIDFEGTDPLANLPAGVTSVNPDNTRGNSIAFVATNAYFFETDGGDIVQQDAGKIEDRAQFANTVFTDATNKLLQTDYTGHLIIDETALGTASFTVRLSYMLFGHSMDTNSGIITIVGDDGGVWKSDRMVSKKGGFTTGLGLEAIGGDNGFKYGVNIVPTSVDFVLTYDATEMKYRLYKDGVLKTTSTEAQVSGEWASRKIYLGFNGQNSDGTDHVNTSTGEFDANGVRNDGRTTDLQTRMDDIQVYQRAITDAEVLTLFNGGNLSVEGQVDEVFNAYPNPVVNKLSFSSDAIYSVDVYNTVGSKIDSRKVENGVDMSDLATGVYFVRCNNKNGYAISTIRVVKK